MGAEIFETGRILGFLLVLTRVAGVFVFVPMPGFNAAPATARIVMSFTLAMCLYPVWPAVPGLDQSVARLLGFVAMDAAIGMALGLTVALAVEAMQLAAQIAGMQAGFGYASSIDPTTAADNTLLPVIAQMTAGLLFFAGGFDRQIIAILAGTLVTAPPGQIFQMHGATEWVAKMGTNLFSYGLRLAFPVIAILLLVDLTLAFLGRLNSQLQLLTLAFPAKIIAALGLFAVLAPIYAHVFSAIAQESIGSAGRLLLRH